MKFLILGAIDTENTKDLELEILKKGHEVAKVNPKDFLFSVENNEFNIAASGVNLLNFDIYLLRGYNISITETRIFVEKLLSLGKIVIDEVVGEQYIPSKLFEASCLSRVGLNHPKTFSILKEESFDLFKEKLDYPVIVKPVDGQKGQDMYKFESEDQLNIFIKKNQRGWLIQECLPIDGDVRVFVVGSEVLGAIKRFTVEGDFRSNASLGANAKEFELTEEIKEIALKAKEAMNCEVAGVDLAWSKEKWYVIEVNFSPQWQKFKEITGLNPAEKIIEYAIGKYNNK
ncbi:RimK family alpha-L-glutamate ligase [bacterium]|jgi:RimK family alpha-L-glutamate ligase|nr:RimK family alpha-L-glutamate ligase [bacterium]MBT4251304.1 RimK family alpha-L-glutamate ligase [bacterium]MBT4598315.1 RimK family alpha-L-glutamate ligase [bacterium]MBT6754148.1 RimK family alpha-L-glutamate ligase [bacterium]MBT7037968.1 RimK family alpha-L-glutamate ligase [bacterium]